MTVEIQHQPGFPWARHHAEIANGNGSKGSRRSSDAAVFRGHYQQRTVIVGGPRPGRLDQDSVDGQADDRTGQKESEGLDGTQPRLS